MNKRFDDAKRSDGAFLWPGDSGLAVVLTAEYEPVNRFPPLAGGQPNYRLMGEMRYEATRGIWRNLDILERHNVPATFFVNGASAEKYAPSVREIVKRGHEVAAHSWASQDHVGMSADVEEDIISHTVKVLTDIAGRTPTGWLTPRAQISENTLDIIAKLGFSWHSDCFDDDLPYVIEVQGKKIVEVPRSTLSDDYAMMGLITSRPFGSPRDMLSYWIDEFEVLHRESRRSARLLSINWHLCMLGRPGVSCVLDEFLAHVKKRTGVWFATGQKISEFWMNRKGPA